ncbi:hypothetical protein CUN85_11035 [Methanolobus halotolerans]|uniref:Uncharacterized protein n=1 Tax=Methanolobus halotolerans TaxID=2052935 RepID=A0A4E0Q3B4_9EURY|nr:hypothetical protein CUN85_11035 [Methanolobus halotolerans]
MITMERCTLFLIYLCLTSKQVSQGKGFSQKKSREDNILDESILFRIRVFTHFPYITELYRNESP